MPVRGAAAAPAGPGVVRSGSAGPVPRRRRGCGRPRRGRPAGARRGRRARRDRPASGPARPGPAQAGQPGRPALARHRRRALPAASGAITILGRDDSADIILDDPGISRRHSEIRVTTDGPHLVTTIRDLGSTNGTFVNGERITSEHLEDGDRITVGPHLGHLPGRPAVTAGV